MSVSGYPIAYLGNLYNYTGDTKYLDSAESIFKGWRIEIDLLEMDPYGACLFFGDVEEDLAIRIAAICVPSFPKCRIISESIGQWSIGRSI